MKQAWDAIVALFANIGIRPVRKVDGSVAYEVFVNTPMGQLSIEEPDAQSALVKMAKVLQKVDTTDEAAMYALVRRSEAFAEKRRAEQELARATALTQGQTDIEDEGAPEAPAGE